MPDVSPRGPNSTGLGWSVTAQRETVGSDEQGNAAQGVEVSFETNRGLRGTVFVPRARYNPANVRAAIQGYVQQLHEVSDLRT